MRRGRKEHAVRRKGRKKDGSVERRSDVREEKEKERGRSTFVYRPTI